GKSTIASSPLFPGPVTSVTSGNATIAIAGTAGAPTVSVGSIAAGNIGAGQVVKGINGQTDAVTLAASNGLSISSPGAGALTVTSNATANNTANDIVSRDANGNFSASTITLSGNLNLPNTASASVGVLNLGGVPFLSNAGPSDTFIGTGAGNLTTTGGSNSAFGTNALHVITTGTNNAAFGKGALQSDTINFDNSAFGTGALQNNNDSSNSFNAQFNSAFGFEALVSNTTASFS